MLRAEMGMKPVPDPMDPLDSEDDFCGHGKSVKSMPGRPESAKARFPISSNRSIASSSRNFKSDATNTNAPPSEKQT